jgi:ATP-dependent helicase HrpB
MILRRLRLFLLCSASAFVPKHYPRAIQLQRFATEGGTKLLETDLPIGAVLNDVRQSRVPNLLLEAPPGAGKTTVIPLVLMEMVAGNIIVVEPRRVAARSAAQRMARMLHEKAGETVGYVMRGESRTSSRTRVIVMTDGVLLNKLREDPELNGVGAIIFDEFHERGVGSDIALALSIESQRQLRPDDLKIIVMSATLLGDSENDDSTGGKLVAVLGGSDRCDVLTSSGRQFPIEVKWANQIPSLKATPLGALMMRRDLLVDTMCDAIEQGLKLAGGDVLAFLPGAAEIRRVVRELNQRGVGSNVEVLPLYGALSKDQQDYAIYPSPDAQRRIIVSSPIAEASLTLERVTCVVDSGLRREPRCDVDTGMPRLVTTRCSKASAIQRAGRAGRVQAGLCLRVYSESEFENRFLEQSPPEIESTDLSPTVLLLADWGCSTVKEIVNDLPFVDAPDEPSLMKAIDLLQDLEALQWKGDGRFVVTPHGQAIAKVPSHPRIATTICKASDDTTLAAALAAAYLLDDDVGGRPNDTADLAPRVRDLFKQKGSSQALLKFATRISNGAKESIEKVFNGEIELQDVTSRLGLALLPGFIDLVAQRKSDASYGGSTYMLSLGRSARLDSVRDAAEFVVVVATSTGDDGTARVRGFASIDEAALLDVAVERDVVFSVPSRGHEVRARRILAVGNLELSSQPLPAPPAEKVTSILLETIRGLGGVHTALLQSLPPDKRKTIQQLRGRVRLAQKLSEDISTWPAAFAALDAQESGGATDDDAMILEGMIEPWLAAAGSLKKINLFDALIGSTSPDQQRQLDSEYPERIEAPDGSLVPISYLGAGPPSASGKLQQFFGTIESPTVGAVSKKVAVSLSLLSPAGKPLAETQDLAFFWKEAYPSARSEMRGRYPKHPWPEDPLQAVATKKTKKQQADGGNNEEEKQSKKKKRWKKR